RASASAAEGEGGLPNCRPREIPGYGLGYRRGKGLAENLTNVAIDIVDDVPYCCRVITRRRARPAGH
ncbi:MAG: hypothetical protein V3S39_03965, partial [Thermodesulfobacteriota bacterium]